MDPVKGSEVIIKELLMPKLTESFEQLAHAAAGADLLVSHPITYAAPIVAEHARLPWLSTVLAPMLFFSKHDPPVLPAMPRVNDVPLVGTWLARRLLPLVRRATRDWGEPVQRLRAKLGLPRGRDPIFEGQFSPHGTLALYSRVLAQPQPDWPPNVTTTGTAFYNGPEPLEPKLEAVPRGRRAARRVHARHVGRRRRGAVLSRERGRRGEARRARRAADGRLRAEPARRFAAERAARRPRAASAAVPARERRRASVRRRHDGAGAARGPPYAARAARPRSVRQCAPSPQARRRAHGVPDRVPRRARRARPARVADRRRATASTRPRRPRSCARSAAPKPPPTSSSTCSLKPRFAGLGATPASTRLLEVARGDGYRWASLDVADLDPPTTFPPY